MAPPPTVEAYLADLPADRRAALETLRRTIRAAAPDATESIAYSMPAFRSHGGQFLVSYAAYKKHDSLFPASGAVVEALGAELTPYLAGKGTIQFPAGQALPLDLVKLLIEHGADVNAKDRHTKSADAGLTVLDIARLNGDTPIVQLLEKYGAKSSAAPMSMPGTLTKWEAIPDSRSSISPG